MGAITQFLDPAEQEKELNMPPANLRYLRCPYARPKRSLPHLRDGWRGLAVDVCLVLRAVCSPHSWPVGKFKSYTLYATP